MKGKPEPPESLDAEEARIWCQGWNALAAFLMQGAPLEELMQEEPDDEETCDECGDEKRKVLGGWRCLNCDTENN